MPITAMDDDPVENQGFEEVATDDMPPEDALPDDTGADDSPDDQPVDASADVEDDDVDLEQRRAYRASDDELAELGFTRKELDEHPRLQKRIDRLTWERNSNREMNAELLARLRNIEERQQESDQEREFTQRSSEHQTRVNELQGKRAELRQRIKDSVENGDLDKVADLQIELSETAADLKFLERDKPAKPQAPQRSPQEGQEPAQADLSAPAAAWVARNSEWFDDSRYTRFRQLAATIERDLLQKGYSQHEDRTYEELDKELKRLAPGLFKGKAPRRQSGPPEGGQRRTSAPSQKRQAGKITEADKKSMSKYGLNPRDPEHRKAWLLQNAPLD